MTLTWWVLRVPHSPPWFQSCLVCSNLTLHITSCLHHHHSKESWKYHTTLWSAVEQSMMGQWSFAFYGVAVENSRPLVVWHQQHTQAEVIKYFINKANDKLQWLTAWFTYLMLFLWPWIFSASVKEAATVQLSWLITIIQSTHVTSYCNSCKSLVESVRPYWALY